MPARLPHSCPAPASRHPLICIRFFVLRHAQRLRLRSAGTRALFEPSIRGRAMTKTPAGHRRSLAVDIGGMTKKSKGRGVHLARRIISGKSSSSSERRSTVGASRGRRGGTDAPWPTAARSTIALRRRVSCVGGVPIRRRVRRDGGRMRDACSSPCVPSLPPDASGL